MSYLNTLRLRNIIAAGNTLARETVLDLLTRIEHYQDKELRQLALDKHPAEMPKLDPTQLKLGSTYDWDQTEAPWLGNNPILDVLPRLIDQLNRHVHINNLVIDPASLRIEFIQDDDKNACRLVAYTKPAKDQK